jgi:hypothetical protein
MAGDMSYLTDVEIADFGRRANEARNMARCAVTAEMRQGFLRLAEDWEALIRRAEKPGFAHEAYERPPSSVRVTQA